MPAIGDRQRLKYQFHTPYFGELSENSYKLPNRATKPHVRKWMNHLAEAVRAAHVPTSPRYVVGVRGHFSDGRRPDISNLFKVALDAVQDGLGVNDKFFQARDDGYETGYLKPELVITIEEA